MKPSELLSPRPVRDEGRHIIEDSAFMATSLTDANAALLASVRPVERGRTPEQLLAWCLDAWSRSGAARWLVGGAALASVSLLLYGGVAATASSRPDAALTGQPVRQGETVAPIASASHSAAAPIDELGTAHALPPLAAGPEQQRTQPLPPSPAPVDDALGSASASKAKAKSRATKKAKWKARAKRKATQTARAATAAKAARAAAASKPRPPAPYSR